MADNNSYWKSMKPDQPLTQIDIDHLLAEAHRRARQVVWEYDIVGPREYARRKAQHDAAARS